METPSSIASQAPSQLSTHSPDLAPIQSDVNTHYNQINQGVSLSREDCPSRQGPSVDSNPQQQCYGGGGAVTPCHFYSHNSVKSSPRTSHSSYLNVPVSEYNVNNSQGYNYKMTRNPMVGSSQQNLALGNYPGDVDRAGSKTFENNNRRGSAFNCAEQGHCSSRTSCQYLDKLTRNNSPTSSGIV